MLLKVNKTCTFRNRIAFMGQIKKILGNNIRRLRTSHGWTQVYLADILNLTPSFLTLVESGQRGMSLEVIESTAEIFRIPVASLFIDHDILDSGNNRAYLRNAELARLKRRLGEEIQRSINASIDELMATDGARDNFRQPQ